MKQAVQIVDLVNLFAFIGLAVVAVNQWRRQKDRAAAWAAASFVSIAFVVVSGRFTPEEPDAFLEHALLRFDVIVLLLFPYLLYRFTTAFHTSSRRVARVIDALTATLILWTIVLPSFPQEGDPRSSFFVAYVVAFVLHWALLSVLVAVRLWRAGRGQPGVARRRMELLSFAAALITVAIVIAAFLPNSSHGVELASGVVVFVSALCFLLGLAPPLVLRILWRQREQARLQEAVGSLMAFSTSQEEIADLVLEPMAAIVGARSVTLRNAAGDVVGSYEVPRPARDDSIDDEVALDVPGGSSLTVVSSRYAPFFGGEELRLLRNLAALTGLALDRSRLSAHEREAREALERADQVKSDFIALAAHELRSPVATAAGIAETLARHRDRLDESKQVELEDAMASQMRRLALLVDQLLDLTRLDAEVVPIEPQRFHVRERVEQLVASAAGEGASGIEVAIDPELEADADPNAFDRIVSNLVTNALRYGTLPIVVAAQQSDRHFRLSVEDRGSGVPPEFVADLFERFTRSSTSSDHVAGTGLGLAIARSYAHAHHGDLLYEPAEPRGARFQLVLPAASLEALPS